MNNTLVMTLASLGVLLWLIASFRERCSTATCGAVWKFVRNFFSHKGTDIVSASPVPGSESAGGGITIDALEYELGIEPDQYLCDRISRIHEALLTRRNKHLSKKKGGTP